MAEKEVEELRKETSKRRKRAILLGVLFIILAFLFTILAFATKNYKVLIGVPGQLFGGIGLLINNM